MRSIAEPLKFFTTAREGLIGSVMGKTPVSKKPPSFSAAEGLSLGYEYSSFRQSFF